MSMQSSTATTTIGGRSHLAVFVGSMLQSLVLFLLFLLATTMTSDGMIVVSAATFSQASFVPPASPTTTSKGPLFFAPITTKNMGTTANNRIVHTTTTTTTTTTTHPKPSAGGGAGAAASKLELSARKKAASAGGGSATTASSKKIQVKLLKHVAGTGQAGQVVLVSPAFYNNKLRPSKLAQKISDEQVCQEQQEQDDIQREILQQATLLQTKLTRNDEKDKDDDDDDFVLVLSAKAGPVGQLFGGIGAKKILEELKRQVPDPYWDNAAAQKLIRIKSLFVAAPEGSNNQKDQKLRGDIKHVGDYVATLSLTLDIMVSIPIRIISQDNLSP